MTACLTQSRKVEGVELSGLEVGEEEVGTFAERRTRNLLYSLILGDLFKPDAME